MPKAYELKRLIELSREHGGPDAEKLLKANWKAIKEWLQESAAITPTPYDDMAVTGLNLIDAPIMKALDQVDGELGN